MKTKCHLFAAMLLISSMAFGKAALIPFDEKVAASDLIARVKIISTHKIDEPAEYLYLAKAEVLDGVKGATTGQIIDLEFHNGMLCPNVTYIMGDDCIIFAAKMDNGHYHTINTYFGKIDINLLKMPVGKDIEFVPGKVLGLGHDSYVVYTEAVAEIKRTMNK